MYFMGSLGKGFWKEGLHGHGIMRLLIRLHTGMVYQGKPLKGMSGDSIKCQFIFKLWPTPPVMYSLQPQPVHPPTHDAVLC